MRRTSRWFAGGVVVVGASLGVALPAVANTVTVNDEAKVLDVARIQADAARLPVSVYVWTTKEDVSRSAFEAAVQAKSSERTPLVVGINLKTHDEVLAGERRIGLGEGPAVDAIDEFDDTLRERRVVWDRNDASDGVEAVLDSVESSLTGQGSTASHRGLHGGLDWGMFILFVALGLVACSARILDALHPERRQTPLTRVKLPAQPRPPRARKP